MKTDGFPEKNILDAAANGDLNAMIKLDHAGFIMCPGETAPDYAARIRTMRSAAHETLDRTTDPKGFEFYPGICLFADKKIPDSVMAESDAITEKHYGFSVNWVPGYFIQDGLGMLWGGCAVSEDRPGSVPVFIIRKNFRYSEKWFLYTRSELLSHELCHAARAPLRDPDLEELFAYAVSSSLLRRHLGNCFQRDIDAILFLVPVFVLLGVQILIHIFSVEWLSAWPFWILAFVWPVWLLIRNFAQRRFYFRAEKQLRKAGFAKPAAALFRCTHEEILKIADMTVADLNAYIQEQTAKDLRWKVISSRFGPSKSTAAPSDASE